MKSKENNINFNNCSDEDLAILWKEGNLQAFEEIVRRYQGKVYATAYRVTGNREDALDVTQEVLLKAYEKINQWEPRGTFLPWLLRLAVNRSIDYLRKRKRTDHESLNENIARVSEDEIRHIPSPESPLDLARAKEIDERIRMALTRLSKTQQTVFMLRHYQGYSLNEIAEHLGCTVGSVKVHLFRALQKLRKELGNIDL
ncbi:MAG TPA: RNA polymerase sigma factor [Candidatus Hydrogenedens sp.]|nr:RNA polymerase sigma factor [Candidatus Hydrogenedens sp.]HOK08273.1 RNA polymerase sigma factor [Candidatus Hydrogenedens sp.]HOL21039.1 RNA polymerase sigma factor [Candidatus Hydrogenedens sp.]HPP59136.1 RNA polymerase sigma factor [Candidatus Hydrogenedens sp.]